MGEGRGGWAPKIGPPRTVLALSFFLFFYFFPSFFQVLRPIRDGITLHEVSEGRVTRSEPGPLHCQT